MHVSWTPSTRSAGETLLTVVALDAAAGPLLATKQERSTPSEHPPEYSVEATMAVQTQWPLR